MKAKTLIILLVIVLISCQKLELKKEPCIITGEVLYVSGTQAEISGNIIDVGDGIVEYGHCWSSNINPSIADTKTNYKGTDTIGEYKSSLTSLGSATKYYTRAYCISSSKIIYGNNISFSTLTPTLPEIETGIVSLIDTNGVTIIGQVVNIGIGQDSLYDYGHCWSTKASPTIEDYKTSFGATTDTIVFQSLLSDLLNKSRYYVRSYAINKRGVVYGEEISFISAQTKPNVEIYDLHYWQCDAGIRTNVTNMGGLPVQLYLCWNTTGNPTLSDSSKMVLDYGSFTNNENWIM